MAQCIVVRFERALEAMGDVQGPAVEVLKTKSTKAKSASKQPPLEIEINQCRKERGASRRWMHSAQKSSFCSKRPRSASKGG